MNSMIVRGEDCGANPHRRIIIKMKKQTKITQDKTQTRSTIPAELVKEFNVTKKDSIEWDNKNGKLKGELKKNE